VTINSTDRPDKMSTDHASAGPAGKNGTAVNGHEYQTRAGETPAQDCVLPETVARQHAASQQARAKSYPAGRVL
jgi:hypothetical protein